MKTGDEVLIIILAAIPVVLLGLYKWVLENKNAR